MAFNETQLPVLSKGWFIAEKIIAVGLVLWGMYALYNLVAVIADMVNSGYIKSRGISYWQVAREKSSCNYRKPVKSFWQVFAFIQ